MVLEVKDLHRGKMVNGVDFTEKGRYSVCRVGGSRPDRDHATVYGADKKQELFCWTESHSIQNPIDARKAGIAFIPEDRRNEELWAICDFQNLSLADTELWAKHGIIDRKFEKQSIQ